MPVQQLVRTTFEYICDLSTVIFGRQGYSLQVCDPQPLVHWIKPPLSCFKCNIDAAMFQEQNKIDFGMIIRDSKGNCVA